MAIGGRREADSAIRVPAGAMNSAGRWPVEARARTPALLLGASAATPVGSASVVLVEGEGCPAAPPPPTAPLTFDDAGLLALKDFGVWAMERRPDGSPARADGGRGTATLRALAASTQISGEVGAGPIANGDIGSKAQARRIAAKEEAQSRAHSEHLSPSERALLEALSES